MTTEKYCHRCGAIIPKLRLGKFYFCSQVCNIMPTNYTHNEARIYHDGFNRYKEMLKDGTLENPY